MNLKPQIMYQILHQLLLELMGYIDYICITNTYKTIMRALIFSIIAISFLLVPVSSLAQDMAYPIEGDGIISFLKRWNRTDSTYFNEFIEINKDRLIDSYNLELGTVYLIPELHPGDIYPPLISIEQPTDTEVFGKKFSKVPLRSNTLKDACFYIISGHGGPDTGAITRINEQELHEDEYAYDFSLRLARNLMMDGATVYIIIQDPNDGIRDKRILSSSNNETCMGQPIPKSQIDRLQQRVEKVNDLYKRDKDKFKYIRAIELHIDSRSPNERIDLFFYYADDPQSRLSSYTLRNEILKQYQLHQPGRGFVGNVSHRDLYVMRKLEVPNVLLEIGNFQNNLDRERILNSNNRNAIANWLLEGFLADYKRVVEQ